MVGGRVFVGWPFLREGLVVAVSDARGRYEKMGGGGRVVSTPHAGQGFGMWRTKAERIEQVYSKRCGVLTGSVDVLLHVRALKGVCAVFFVLVVCA
jgi:5'-3' exoribonuclease 1